ncbi:unnamed protein product [Arabidopsis lyrata]|uniref:Uncharacterized protein n=2 Tax=Arabidopsis TaxID=3701 RepID=D7LR66_ARALL|nr:hypothetical protein ARALYDRAFT_904848 [Arabidopsis lyrata subsp. lyrata]KAG7558827.1 hypothetical protein ISN45_Aa05g004540 [Arabidopsis thaliana x Arabidopsis arenosa]CAH8266819.1 unnamed protein product [Arabidopsis lyrata]
MNPLSAWFLAQNTNSSATTLASVGSFTDHLQENESQGRSAAKNVESPLMAEATTLLPAIQRALELGYTTISFASNSQ